VHNVPADGNCLFLALASGLGRPHTTHSVRRDIVDYIQQHLQDDCRRHLVTLCETRFIERHDDLIVFAELYGHTLHALDAIAQQSRDRKAVDKANSLSRAITDPGVIVALCCA
jgi:hypothetical protein